MATMETRSVRELLPEQRRCLEEFTHDLRDVFADPACVRTASTLLADAMHEDTLDAWAAVVNMIAKSIFSPATDAPAGPCRRLVAFVRENADLVEAAS